MQNGTDTSFAQEQDWGKLDYTAMGIDEDVLRDKLKDTELMPTPLSLEKIEVLKKDREVLHENDQLYIVHHPSNKEHIRCTNAELLRVLKGKLASHRLAF